MSGLVQKRLRSRGNGSNPIAAGRSISLRSLQLLSVGEPVSPAFALTASLQTLNLPAMETMEETQSKVQTPGWKDALLELVATLLASLSQDGSVWGARCIPASKHEVQAFHLEL